MFQPIRRFLRGSFYRKSLVTILLVACVPSFIIGLGTFLAGRGQMEARLQELHQKQLERAASNIDGQLANLEVLIEHWAFDPQFGNVLAHLDFIFGYQRIRNIYATLLVMEGSNNLIGQAQLLLEKPQPLLFTPDVYFTPSRELIDTYHLKRQEKNLFWTRTIKRLNAKTPANEKAISLVYKIPGDAPKPFGELVLVMNPRKIADLVGTLSAADGGAAFLLDQQDNFIFTDTENQIPTELEKKLREEVLLHPEKSTFLFNWHGNKYAVSYAKFLRPGMNWSYVSATPLDAIIGPVEFVSKLMLGISLACLFLAFLLAWFGSHRLYSPVKRLVKNLAGALVPIAENAPEDEFKLIEMHWRTLAGERQALQKQLNVQIHHVREGFLLQLAQGSLYSLSEKEIRERLARYGWDVKKQQYVALVMQITDFDSEGGKFSGDDEALASFAAANIMEELTSGKFAQFQVLNFHDLTIGLLLCLFADRQTVSAKAMLDALCQEMITAINNILRLKVTIAVSNVKSQVNEVPDLFEEARQALSYRNTQYHNQIIDAASLDIKRENEPHYPFVLERTILQALRTKSEEEVVRLLGQFLQELSRHNATELFIRQGMLHLLGSMLHEMMRSGFNLHQLPEENLYEACLRLKKIPDFLHWFEQTLVKPYMQEMKSRQDLYTKQIVERIITHMREHFMNEISLDYYADEAGISLYSLSKAFKKTTGLNFIEYLTELRMEHAKRLLRETDLKVGEVARKSGYQASYFNRIFRKHVGYSPSQYKDMWMKEL